MGRFIKIKGGMEIMKNKLKMNKESRLIITEDAGEEEIADIFEETKTVKKLKRYIADAPVNLGSCNNPNKKIKNFKWEVGQKEDKNGTQ